MGWNSGGGGGALTINTNHVFTDETARDSYFMANPLEKKTGLLVSAGAGFWQWDSITWISKTGLIKGAKGDKGDTNVSQGYTHTQAIPSGNWIIQHDLNKIVDVEVIVGGELVKPDIVFNNLNRVTLIFCEPVTGTAELN